MALFKYKALNPQGQSYEATLEAPDRFSVYRKVKADGDTVVFVNETTAKSKFSVGNYFHFSRGVKMHDKIIFARNLAAMIEAGLSVTRALAVMEKQTKNARLKAVLKGLDDDISKGTSLSESMKRMPETFSPIFISMVRAGEESGNLSGALKTVSLQMEKTYTLTKKVKGALMYPAVIFSIMIIIGVLMLVYMVPTLTATFQGLGVQLPLSTRIIVGVSDFLRFHYLIALGTVLIVGFSISAVLKSASGKRAFDYMSTRFPIIGPIVKEINAARMARTLSSLMSSGVDVVVALSF
jgi:type IV pilus assembly protein PilC